MDKVRHWLEGIRLQQYGDVFETNGWDEMETVLTMNESDIKEIVQKPGHVRKLSIAINKLNQSDNLRLDTYAQFREGENQESDEVTLDRKSDRTDTDIDAQRGIIHDIQYSTAPKDDRTDTDIDAQRGIIHDIQYSTAPKDDRTDTDIDAQRGIIHDIQYSTAPKDDRTDTDIDAQREIIHDIQYSTAPKDDRTDTDIDALFRGKDQLLKVDELSRVSQRGIIHDIQYSTAPKDDTGTSVCQIPFNRHPQNTDDKNLQFLSSEESDTTEGGASLTICSMKKHGTDSDLSIYFPTEEQTSLVKSKSLNTTVIDSKNVTIAKNIQIIQSDAEETETKFESQISCCLDNQRSKEKLFVQTGAYRESKDILEDRNWVVVIGNPGDGKSAIAYQLLLDHERNGFNAVIVTSPQDWKNMVSGKPIDKQVEKQIVLIDNMFGVFGTNEQITHEWLCLLEVMGKVVSERNGCLKVICSSRKDIYNKIDCKIAKYPEFRKLSIVDLTVTPFLLSFEKKLRILNTYFDFYNIRKYCSSGPLPEDIARIDLSYGFPHCVEMYCTNPLVRKHGINFFQYPLEVVQKEIDHYQMNEKTKYCALILLLLSENNALCMERLDSDSTIFQTCLKLSGLTSNNSVYVLHDAFVSLRNVYLVVNRGSYRFKHDSFREIVAVHFLRSFPKHAIQLLEVNILLNRSYLVLEAQPQIRMTVDLPEKFSNELAERFADELIKPYAFQVLSHNSWSNKTFQDLWLKYVTKGRPADSVLKKLIAQKYVIGFCQIGFLTCLAFCKHEQLLMRLISLPNISSYFEEICLVEQATSALVFSTYNDLSDLLLKTLIDVGADVNGTFQEINIFLWMTLPPFGFSPLMIAVDRGNVKNVEMILKHGADIYQFHSFPANTFQIAMMQNNSSILEILANHLENDVAYAKTQSKFEGKTCLMRIKRFVEIRYSSYLFEQYLNFASDANVFQIISNYMQDKTSTVDRSFESTATKRESSLITKFYSQVREPVLEVAKILMEKDDSIYPQSQSSALNMILKNRQDLLRDGFSRLPLSLVENVNFSYRDDDGCIPIFYALMESNEIHIEVLEYFLDRSDIMFVDQSGRNCFHFLAQSQFNMNIERLVNRLKERGLDINQPDYEGNLALSVTASLDVFEVFVENGAKFDTFNRDGACMIMQILSLNVVDVLGKVSFLLSHGLDANHINIKGKTIMHHLLETTYLMQTKRALTELLIQYKCQAFLDKTVAHEIFRHLFQNSDRIIDLVGAFRLLTEKVSHLLSLTEINDSILPLISKSNASSMEKVACLDFILDTFDGIDPVVLFECIMCMERVDLGSISKVLQVLSKTNIFHLNSKFICKTLLSEHCDSVKLSLLEMMASESSFQNLSFDTGLLSSRQRLKLLESRSCLPLLQKHGFPLESLNVADVPFHEIATSKGLVNSFSFYASKGIELQNILGGKYIPLLANEFARNRQVRPLYALLKKTQICEHFMFDQLGNTLIHNVVACLGRTVTKILKLICLSTEDVNAKNIHGETPIYIACSQTNPNLSAILWLVLNGASLNFLTVEGISPLQLLTSHISQNRRFYKRGSDKVLTFIRRLFPTKNEMSSPDDFDKSPLMYIIQFATDENLPFGTLLYILKNKLYIEHTDMDGRGLLHYVALSNMSDNAKTELSVILIEQGEKNTSLDIHGQCAIEMSLYSKTPCLKLCKELSREIDVEKYAQALMNNIKHDEVDDEEIKNQFLEQIFKMDISENWQDITGTSLLSMACRFGRLWLVKKLLYNGSDPNLRDLLGQSPIFNLLFSEMVSSICMSFCECFGLSLSQELELQANSTFPWHIKTKCFYLELKNSLQRQTSVNLSIHNKLVERINSCLEILQVLLEGGADPNQVDMYGYGPLHYCAEAPIIDTLICPFMEILLLNGADVNLEDFNGRTPIMLCASFGRTKHRRMNILINYGSDLCRRDYNGHTIHDYAKRGFSKMFQNLHWTDEKVGY